MDVREITKNARTDVQNDIFKIRISTKLKEDFKNVCSINGVDVSSVVRTFMRAYIDEYTGTKNS